MDNPTTSNTITTPPVAAAPVLSKGLFFPGYAFIGAVLIIVVTTALFLRKKKDTDLESFREKVTAEVLVEEKFKHLQADIEEEFKHLENKIKNGEKISEDETLHKERLLRELGDAGAELKKKVEDIEI
ncbi:hypothetical protein K2P96_02370 [Patescibacteria group bacterium]|nr:hypothetical protein [Patescibacteria group bacterium]